MQGDAASGRLPRWVVALFVLATIAGGIAAAVVIPRRADHRRDQRSLRRAGEAITAMTLTYERCLVRDAPPEAYGRVILDGLLLDRSFQRLFMSCTADYRQDLAALEARLAEVAPGLDDRAGLDPPPPLRNPGRADICTSLAEARGRRRAILEHLGLPARPLAAMDCPSASPPAPTALDAPDPAALWRAVEVRDSGAVQAIAEPDVERRTAPRAVRVRAGEAPTVIELSAAALLGDADAAAGDELGPPLLHLHWDESGPTALLPGEPRRRRARFVAASWQPERGSFGRRTLSIDRLPRRVWMSDTRWFFLVPTRSGELELRISDDAGESFSALEPRLSPTFAMRATGHANRGELLLLGIDGGLETPARFEALRVSEDGEARLQTLGLRGPPPVWAAHIHACPTASGALALVDGRAVIEIADRPRLVHEFSEVDRLEHGQADLACVGDQAVILARRRIEPAVEPPLWEVASRGGPLLRFICDRDGCDEGTTVVDWAIAWDVRTTQSGVRALVRLHVAPEDSVHLVDEPLGGPIDAREPLFAHASPLDAAVWDGVTFHVRLEPSTPASF